MEQSHLLLQPLGASVLVTRERWAELTGLPLGVIEAQCDKGYWPTVRKGKYSLINVAQIQQESLLQGR
ncbi:hypothetical protein GCM10007350_27830 [Jeongeupia chitinilytica]|uniref:DNA-binding protein n=1 Tax=Jeongeupia chitinilytica TaxID=1041641 RepID=A0ABQ3H2G1_9NEIS|nr:hypothetical protein GCM10007350_27830 [Jeongeupia chitinilytica]